MLIKQLLIKEGRTSKAVKHILYSFILKGLSIVIGFLYVPLLLDYLTQEKYGIWLTLTSIIGWFSFFNIGLGNGLRNKLAESFARGNNNLGQIYISTTYAILISIFSVVLFIFHLCNFFLNWNSILNTQSVDNNELYILTSIVFSFFIIRFVFQLIEVVYFADQRPSMGNVIATLGNVFSFILVLIVIHSTVKGNLILLGSIISAIPVIVLIVITFLAFNGKYKLIKPSIKKIDFKQSKGLMNLGFKFFFMQITSIIMFSTSSFFIAQFYGPEEVVVYNIAFKLFQMPYMVFSIVLSPIWSAVTDAYVKSDHVWLTKTLKRLNILSFLFSLGVIFLLLISKWIFKVWIGNKVIIPLDLLITMAIYTIIRIWNSPYSVFINGFGKIKLTTSLTFMSIIIYFVLIFSLSAIFRNSTGVLLAVIGASLVGVITQPWQANKILNGKAKGIWNK